MEVTYTLMKDDLIAFRHFHARSRAKWRGVNQFLGVVLVLMWIVQLLLIVRVVSVWRYVLPMGPKGWEFLVQAHQHLLLNFFVFSLFLAYRFWGPRLLAGRQGPTAAQLSQPKHMRIGPDGVEVAAPQEQERRAWSDIPFIGSDPDCLYLYVSPTNALVVPRRAFPTPAHAQAFEAQARAFQADPYLRTAPEADTADAAAVWPPRPTFAATQKPLPAPAPELQDVPGTLRVSYVTTKADLLRTQIVFLPRRPAALLAIFVPYVTAAGFWTLQHLPPTAAILWAVVVAFVGTLLTLAWAIQKALTRSFARFPEGRPCETIARPDLLCDVTPNGRKIYRWSDVSAIQMRGGDVYVFSKKLESMYIPRSAFADQAVAEAFVQSLRAFWQQGRTAPLALPPAPDAVRP